MTDPSLPDNDAFELAQRIAEECSVDHSWFHFTKCATLIEQFVAERLAAMEARGTTEEAISALSARVAELEGGLRRIDAALRVPAAEYVPAIGDAFSIIDALAPPQPQPSKEGK
jgi:hypothetical protein